jgi:acyl-coenzyme A thioesterase PaaI-like protein
VEITNIPFFGKVGIRKESEGSLILPADDSVLNHLNTVAASALFTLAEAASGDLLQTQFPELVGKVIPVLRDAKIKFRKPATGSVITRPSIAEETLARFNEQFARKGRSTIEVVVAVIDNADETVCSGTFNWFVQRLEA